MDSKILFCEHPHKPLKAGGEYCSYYSEIFYALRELIDIEFISYSPHKISELGKNWKAIILGFGHTDCGDGNSPKAIINDTNTPLFTIINKEYTGLNEKLNWIKNMNATAALTVLHKYNEYTKETGIPFHRIMWSCNEKLFKNYGGDYRHDLFYSGVIRQEQSDNLRDKICNREAARLVQQELEQHYEKSTLQKKAEYGIVTIKNAIRRAKFG